MLDFDNIVLATLQNTFSRTIVVNPIVSRAGGPSYAGRGVYSTGPVDIIPMADAVFSDQKTTVWIRASEYSPPPAIGDQIEIPAFLNYPPEGVFEVQDVDRWAEGKVLITLKKLQTDQA